MVKVVKIDSNVTGLRYAEETSLKVLPGSPVWIPLEPNTYGDWGGSNTLKPRNPINASRQREKGVIVDFDASGGIQQDLTQKNLQDLQQGFFFADFRRKGEEIVTGVDESGSGTEDSYAVADTTGFLVNSLVQGQNFTNSANNAVNVVTAVVPATSVDVADGVLVDEAGPPADAQIVVVGYQAPANDIDVDVSGDFATYTSTVTDFTTWGLIEGETIFVGGDAAANQFPTNATNNGSKRVRSIAANALVVDKSPAGSMVTEVTAGGEEIQFYFGRVLKNELGTLIKRRTYNLERTLGAPDDALPTEIQAEYMIGGVPNEQTWNIAQADNVLVDLSFLAVDAEYIDGPTPLKTGTRPALESADAFNTSDDFSSIRMSIVSSTDEAPTPLFAFLTDWTLTQSNNLVPNKAVSVRGAFEVTAGTFQVGGNITAYFADIAAVQAVNANSDITLDAFIVKANAGIAIDLPLIALGDGRPNVEQDQAITLPLETEAARGRKIDPNLDYTLMLVFYDYLPDLADL